MGKLYLYLSDKIIQHSLLSNAVHCLDGDFRILCQALKPFSGINYLIKYFYACKEGSMLTFNFFPHILHLSESAEDKSVVTARLKL